MKYYDHEPAYVAIRDRGGTGWDDWNVPASTDSYTALEEMLASLPPGDAIDLGCGGGQCALRLAAHGHRVTGVDFSPTAIELARRNAPDITFVVGDCTELALPSAAFDLAVDNHVLHCLIGTDRARFVREAARVLRPGGLLFSETMSREGAFDPTCVQCDPVTFVSAGGRRYWTSARELDAELEAAGFTIELRETRPNPGFGDNLVRLARLA